MQLATIQTPLGPRAAALWQDNYVDLHATDSALPASLRELLAEGPALLQAVAHACQRQKVVEYPAEQVKLLPPIPDPPKIVCLGLNYSDHAKESGAQLPKNPILFSKYRTALIGPGDAIILPCVSKEVDFEAELVVVVGKRGRPKNETEAMTYVAGYTIGHDVSARDWQLKKDGKQWMVGKTFDTFAPTGPHLVTPDEISDPHNLAIRLRLNGETMQDSNTGQMIFSVGAILAYLAQIFTLEPGDLVFTGTPSGVGLSRKPPLFLRAGQVVRLGVEGVGLQQQRTIEK